MNYPSVSIIVPTYARTSLLAECVESFRRQDYQGDMELLIGNDCELQTLDCAISGVEVVNFDKTFEFNCAKKNALIRRAAHDLLCFWDDDDIYMPSFVSHCVKRLRDEDQAVRLRKIAHYDGRIVKRLNGSLYHTMIIRKEAMMKVGGFPETETGDFGITPKLVAAKYFNGEYHNSDDGIPAQMIYRHGGHWIHMEGHDAPRMTQKEFREKMKDRINTGLEPSGDVLISPSWSEDFISIAAQVKG